MECYTLAAETGSAKEGRGQGAGHRPSAPLVWEGVLQEREEDEAEGKFPSAA